MHVDIYSLCVCVCVRACVRACGIKETFVHLKRFFIFSNSTHQCMCRYIVQSSVTSKTTHNLLHIDTITTIRTIANTIMSTKLTDDTLQLFIVKSPISTMTIHIAFKFTSFEHNFPLVHPMRRVYKIVSTARRDHVQVFTKKAHLCTSLTYVDTSVCNF